MATRVLAADDQEDVLVAARLLLKSEGFLTECVSTPEAVLAGVKRFLPDLVLMDLNYSRDTTSGAEGLDLLDRLARLPHRPKAVVMTAWGSIELAVEAMRRGAVDFVLKPWENARLVETLRKHAGSAGAWTIAEDLQIAARVQAGLLPQQRPMLDTLDCWGYCRQAGAVGGDFYDFLDLEPGRAALILGDISGKGIAAALLMAHLQASLRATCAAGSRNLVEWVGEVNRDLHRTFPQGSYSTLFLGVYDDLSRELGYVNCGHVPPLVCRASGEVSRLETTAPPLGILPRIAAECGSLQLGTGDRLIICSDGVVEAAKNGAELGEAGLLRLWKEQPGQSPEELASRVVAWSGSEPADDLTLLLAHCH
jgi:sigma-B regulation protein RsbU (phosphoserine phosphatase)